MIRLIVTYLLSSLDVKTETEYFASYAAVNLHVSKHWFSSRVAYDKDGMIIHKIISVVISEE